VIRLGSILFYITLFVSGAMLATASWLVLAVAPVEEVMGLVQKIFYLHVPSAMAMYLGVLLCSVASLMFLLTRRPGWDAASRAGAEVATLFCLIVLTTGPIWAYNAWGMAWVWDPRLTGVAVLGLILASYHLVRDAGQESAASKRLAAALGVLAAPNGVLIHFAVTMWGGQHPTVIYESGGLDRVMLGVFLFCVASMVSLFAVLTWWRLDLALLTDRAESLRMRVMLELADEPRR
jgi:heme exporter protein C